MKKLIALFPTLFLLALLACQPPGPGPDPAGTPHSIDLSGQQGLYLQGGGASASARSITAPAVLSCYDAGNGTASEHASPWPCSPILGGLQGTMTRPARK
jgi:hypothetical protein